MGKFRKSFSDSLTTGQIQQILDALDIPWRDYSPNDQGWVDIPSHHITYGVDLNSDLGVNIYHGGWVDHYLGNDDPAGSGDIVQLVAMSNMITGFWYKESINKKHELRAIDVIKQILGIDRGVPPPELVEGGQFANNWLSRKDNHFVRVPDAIWKSGISSSAIHVWMALFSRCGSNDIYAFPGLNRISKDTGLSRRTVQRSIKELKKAGFIVEKRKPGKAPNRYPIVHDNRKTNESDQNYGQNDHPPSQNDHPLWSN